jgi:hypothetical protein
MSTIDIFREMSGINQTNALEITPHRAEEIVQIVSANQPPSANAGIAVKILAVSTYVNNIKEPDAGFAYVAAKQPPFASHWGIVIGDPNREALLMHLLLHRDKQTGQRVVKFHSTQVDEQSDFIISASVKHVGHTFYEVFDLMRIGREMIDAFGSYHLVFWNCQTFAKCYLRVITGSDSAFTHWTSADVTNLFLCALVVPMPIASTSRSREKSKMRQLQNVGMQAATGNRVDQSDNSKEALFKASDEIIDLMQSAWSDDETLMRLSRPVKDSADKPALIKGVKEFILKAFGY